MFYWTRGNESVSGLDTLQLAQYTVEDHYTSVSEAVYETGNDIQNHSFMLLQCWCLHSSDLLLVIEKWSCLILLTTLMDFFFVLLLLKGNYPKLVFHFELKRSILYFILETYVPSSLLVVLSWVSFWISLSSVPARICIGVHLLSHIQKQVFMRKHHITLISSRVIWKTKCVPWPFPDRWRCNLFISILISLFARWRKAHTKTQDFNCYPVGYDLSVPYVCISSFWIKTFRQIASHYP